MSSLLNVPFLIILKSPSTDDNKRGKNAPPFCDKKVQIVKYAENNFYKNRKIDLCFASIN
jgi:hypothetical protein